MAEDRTTVIETGSRGGGAGWFIGAILVIALVVGGYFLMRSSDSSTAKDNAITHAANQVGNAAEKAGSAAEDAAGGSTK